MSTAEELLVAPQDPEGFWILCVHPYVGIGTKSSATSLIQHVLKEVKEPYS